MVGMLEAMRTTFGEEGLQKLVEKRTSDQIKIYEKQMPAGKSSLQEKVEALTAIRSREGYMAEWSQCQAGRFEFIENNCPICVAAQSCQLLCSGEMELFQAVLGKDVSIERTEHIINGSRRCVYHIRKADTVHG